jgi:hypothetical protein
MTLRSMLPLLVAVVLALPASAQAASGITILSPKANAKIAVGERPTFKLRVKGSGQVYVHVCKNKKKDAKGVICNNGDTEDIGRAKRKKGIYQYKGKFFDFPEYWLNSPGTYYWQAYRIACEGGNTSDCLQESKIVKIKVVG